MSIIGKVEILEGESVPLLSRVRAYDGGYLIQADVSSIAYQVDDLDDPTATGDTGSLTTSDVIFDTLQTGNLWTEDDTGYNFAWTPDASLFVGATIAGGTKVYRVEVKITLTSSSNKIMLVWLVEVLNTHSGSAGVADLEAYSGLGYCSRAHMESMFGRENIAKWSDMENTDDAQLGFARVSRAIVVATAEIDDRMRTGPYVIPFVTPPTTIVNLAASLAGVWLYESRGIEDFDEATGQPFHRLAAHKAMALRILSELHANTRSIDAPTTSRSGVNAPFIVPG